MAINQTSRALPDHSAMIALTSCYHNLLRAWSEA
jgi:predicted 2-oxoglutarate/Fe(II)-dependent dioxygenase YbiX